MERKVGITQLKGGDIKNNMLHALIIANLVFSQCEEGFIPNVMHRNIVAQLKR